MALASCSNAPSTGDVRDIAQQVDQQSYDIDSNSDETARLEKRVEELELQLDFMKKRSEILEAELESQSQAIDFLLSPKA